MSNRVMLVPGTGGTQLLKDGQSIGHPVVLNLRLWLLDAFGADVDETVRDMSMKHVPGQMAPVLTTQATGSKVEAGPVLQAAYHLVLGRGGVTFPYDWRGDIEHSARTLVERLHQGPVGGGQWKIIAHSQGGLVVIVASQLMGSEFARRVSHVAFVAVPIYGTINAAHALLVGDNLGAVVRSQFKWIAGTWPALYQMLPDWHGALREKDGAASPYSFFHTATWTRFGWVDEDLVVRAAELRQKYLRHPATALAGVRYSFLFAQNRKTRGHAIRQEDGRITFEAPDVDGDSLVPFAITYGRMDDVIQQRTHAIGPDENNQEHAMMLVDDWVVTRVLDDLDA